MIIVTKVIQKRQFAAFFVPAYMMMHHHRAEHWIVVSDSANVIIDHDTQLVTENKSVYIPIGAVHALENPGKVSLELIEMQSGVGEDDIIRLSDRYGRIEKT